MERLDIIKLRRHLLEWYRKNSRRLPWRETQDPYAIWVSEVMLQQTQVATVIPYFQRFMQRFPDTKALAQADLQQVLKLWEGLGYYARARNLHRAVRIVEAKFEGRVPCDWEAFRGLPGVGDYIAAAVLSIAFECPYAVVDGNVKRVLSRLLLIETPVNRPSAFKQYKGAAEKLFDAKHPAAFNQALMELGALICLPRNPLCQACPLNAHCRAHREAKVAEFPKRQSKNPLPQVHIAVGVVYRNERVLITRRKPEGLLGGLWEFPGGRIETGEGSADACVREIKEEVNLEIGIDRFLTRVRHAYTHFKIVMDVYLCRYVAGRVKLNGPDDFRWVKLQELAHYPFPGANHKFIPLLPGAGQKTA